MHHISHLQEWLDYINPRVLGTVDAAKTGTPILPPGAPTALDPEMKKRFANMLERAEALAAAADEAGVTIMFDAEQSKCSGARHVAPVHRSTETHVRPFCSLHAASN